MVGLAAGRIGRHRVTFEEPVETQDGTTGAVEVLWQAVAGFENVHAEINERSVRENVGGAQMQVTTSIVITVRWRPGFSAKQRIVWATGEQTRVFNISGLLTDTATARTWIEIPVVELV
jgi:head-tail adaptor